MDKVITGTNAVHEAIDLYQNAKAIFSEAKMNLGEWKTSSSEVKKAISEIDLVKEENMIVLGHCWNTNRDTLALKQVNVFEEERQLTKRSVLRQIASLYDPLGIFLQFH